eukprot:1304048-Pyramimonas_sp.AAC.1
MSDSTQRGRLRRHWRASCLRKVARKRPRLQCGVSRWRSAKATASGRYVVSRKTRFFSSLIWHMAHTAESG